ncbi:MAG: hypothetical protein ABEJ03_02480, partial [Candidatus Nanohaloarchaea archaeon]
GVEYRVGRQNFEDEPAVAVAKAAAVRNPHVIREVFQEREIDPGDRSTVPDVHEDEYWEEVMAEVYSHEDVLQTAREQGGKYFEDFVGYAENSLEGFELESREAEEVT